MKEKIEMSTLLLSRNDALKLLEMSEVIETLEQAFKNLGHEQAQMPPKAYLVLAHGDFRAMPAAIPGAVGMNGILSFLATGVSRKTMTKIAARSLS